MSDPGFKNLENALRDIVEGTATETGEAFFAALVKHLANAMGTRYAWVTEWLEDVGRLRALAFWAGDRYVDEYEYDVAGTPCEPVLNNRKLVHVPERIVQLFPQDPDLPPLGGVSYMGVPLFDTDGRILGHLAILHDEPLPENPQILAIFNIFAGRAAAELRRLRRDQALQDSQKHLAALFDHTMDAIVELDDELKITRMNPGAETLFSSQRENVLGRPFRIFLNSASHGRLAYLARELERKPEQRHSLWVPEGLQGVRAGGGTFPAEATLSRFELDGKSHFTLILRNVDERREAEERIASLLSETEDLRARIDALQGFGEIIGRSDALRRVLQDVDKVAGGDTTVLITGETGTGKEMIARAVHERSARAAKPLVSVNCAAIPANLQESEFFGHEKGAFTGATQRRAGRFKRAHGGTIFLDEVGELPLDLQAKLLRVLQEGEFEPVGGTRTERVDVRVITATNRDLSELVANGSFRSDLLYRLNVFPIHLPPLRDRDDDLVLLAEAFLDTFARQRGRAAPRLTPDAIAKLRRYDWPGNIRELQNVLERAVILSEPGGALHLERALPDVASAGGAPASGDDQRQDAPILTATELRDLERNNIVRALHAAGGKVSGRGGAAELLGLPPNTLASRMKSLHIDRSRG